MMSSKKKDNTERYALVCRVGNNLVTEQKVIYDFFKKKEIQLSVTQKLEQLQYVVNGLYKNSFITERVKITLENELKEVVRIAKTNPIEGYVKIHDECYIEDCFDNEDKRIDGRFTGVYLKNQEIKNGGKL